MTACVMWSACAPTLEDVRGALAAGRPLDLLMRLGARWWAWGVTVRDCKSDGRLYCSGAGSSCERVWSRARRRSAPQSAKQAR